MNEEFGGLNEANLIPLLLKSGIQPSSGLLLGYKSQRNANPMQSLMQTFGFAEKTEPSLEERLSEISRGFQQYQAVLDNKKQEDSDKRAAENKELVELYKSAGFDPQKTLEVIRGTKEIEQEYLPYEIMRQRIAGDEATRQTTQQLAAVYPYLSAAGREQTGRALAASERYLRTKEQMPSKIQDIMASKQQQQLSAQAGEADLMRAVAAQQQAAKQFAGTFAGKYISAG